jgi:hypothetical protein
MMRNACGTLIANHLIRNGGKEEGSGADDMQNWSVHDTRVCAVDRRLVARSGQEAAIA